MGIIARNIPCQPNLKIEHTGGFSSQQVVTEYLPYAQFCTELWYKEPYLHATVIPLSVSPPYSRVPLDQNYFLKNSICTQQVQIFLSLFPRQYSITTFDIKFAFY